MTVSQQPIRWPLPEKMFWEDFQDRTVAYNHGEGKRWINLTNPKTQAWLYRSFRRIVDVQSALRWCHAFGCPFASSQPVIQSPFGCEALDPTNIYNLEDVVGLARTVRWLWYFFSLLRYKEEPFLRKHLRTQTKFDRAVANLSSDELENGVTDRLKWYWLCRCEENQQDGYVVFNDKGTYEDSGLILVDKVFRSSSPAELLPHQIEVECADLAKLDDPNVVLSYSAAYLEKLLQLVALQIEPRVTVVPSPAGFALKQTYTVTNPWEAIVAELLTRITGAPAPIKCDNPRCNRIFVPTRKDNRYCGRSACRQAGRRKNSRVSA